MITSVFNNFDSSFATGASENSGLNSPFGLPKCDDNIILQFCSSKYFIVGAEKEDIIQEGMIGLFKAIKGFNPEKQSSFKSFANICIERQLITAIKSSNRQKHMPLNSYLSFNAAAYEENDDTSLLEVFEQENTSEDPLDIVTKKEYYNFVEDRIEETLSDFEKQVLHRYTNGESYTEIAEKVDAPVKSVDNAIQRIRKKTIKNILL